jgi:hypothetical protein
MNHVHSPYAIVMVLEKQKKNTESKMRAIIESNEIGIVKEGIFISHFYVYSA